MKAPRSTSPALAVCSAFLLVGAVALSGCTASTLAGPEAPPEAPVLENADHHRPSPVNGAHNNGTDGGGGTVHGASHNEMPGE